MPDVPPTTTVPPLQPGKEMPVKSVLPSLPPTEPKEEKALPPINYPPFHWEKCQSLLKQIEDKIQSKLLVYYVEPGTLISNADVDFFFSHIRDLQSESSLTLILVSSGGSGLAAWRIANMLRNYCKTLTVIIPSRCASAATMLALSAEKLLIGPAGYLTAIDTSLSHPLNPRPSERSDPADVSVDQINRIKKMIDDDLKVHPGSRSLVEILFEKIHPVVLGELERTSSLSKLIAKNMTGLRTNQPPEEETIRIINLLNDSYPTHGYPIVLREAQKIGLPAEPTPVDLNPLLWETVKLYSLISKKVITNFTPTLYHLEIIPVIIESAGKRTFFSYSYDRRLMPQPGVSWVIENDRSRWLSATPDPEHPEKPKFSEIEL